MRSAAIQSPRLVSARSYTSTVRTIAATYVPKPEPAVARKSNPKAGDRRTSPRRLFPFTALVTLAPGPAFLYGLFRPCPRESWPQSSARSTARLRLAAGARYAPRIAFAMRPPTMRAMRTSAFWCGTTIGEVMKMPACARVCMK